MTGSTSRLPLLLIGAGGHAKVAAEIAVQNEAFDLVGFIDQHPVGTLVNGVPVVGSDEHLPSLWDMGIRHIHVAIGNNLLRSRLGQQVSNLGFTLSTLISPAACISPSARLGHGSVIMAGAILKGGSYQVAGEPRRSRYHSGAEPVDFRRCAEGKPRPAGPRVASEECSLSRYTDVLEELISAAVAATPYLELARTYADQLSELGFNEQDAVSSEIADRLQELCSDEQS